MQNFHPDPVSVISERQTMISNHRAELTAEENEIDKEQAGELAEMFDTLAEHTREELDKVKINVNTKLKDAGGSAITELFSCNQAALRTLLSVCPSLRPSVTPFWQCSSHHIILKFSGDITIDRHDVYAKGQGQRSKVKVTEVMTPLSRFRTVTPVWIHIWQ